jgi:hypothetical protein
VVGALILGGAGYCYYSQYHLPKQQAALTTTYAVDTSTITHSRAATDLILRGEAPLPRAQARRIVKGERQVSDKALRTSEKRVANLQKQLKPGWVKLFGEVDYVLPAERVEGALSARVGAMIRIRQNTNIIGYVSQPISGMGQRTYHVGVRQEIRIL